MAAAPRWKNLSVMSHHIPLSPKLRQTATPVFHPSDCRGACEARDAHLRLRISPTESPNPKSEKKKKPTAAPPTRRRSSLQACTQRPRSAAESGIRIGAGRRLRSSGVSEPSARASAPEACAASTKQGTSLSNALPLVKPMLKNRGAS